MFHIFSLFKNKCGKKQQNYQKDEDGRALIDISIEDKSEVLSPYHVDKMQVINGDFAGMLDNVVKAIPPKQAIHLKLHCAHLTNKEKETFALATKRYYENRLINTQLLFKRYMVTVVLSVVLSVFFFLALWLTKFLNLHWLVFEIVDICAWVFLWEAIDVLAYQCISVRLDKKRINNMCKCKISYK